MIRASPEAIFDVLADPAQHSLIDGSGMVQGVAKEGESTRLALGVTFGMSMKMGISYATASTVVEFEENRRIAWHHFAQFVWRYELEEVEGGTMVTESFNYDKPWAFVIIAMGFPEKNRLAMQATLRRLEELVTS